MSRSIEAEKEEELANDIGSIDGGLEVRPSVRIHLVPGARRKNLFRFWSFHTDERTRVRTGLPEKILRGKTRENLAFEAVLDEKIPDPFRGWDRCVHIVVEY